MSYTLSTRSLLLIGLLASIIVGVGEYLLHFLPDGPGGEVSMLEHVPLKRASKGHFFVVFGAPLYFSGFYGLMKFFSKGNSLLSGMLFISGVLSFAVGGVWVSSRYFAAEVLQRSSGTEDHAFYLQSYEDHYQVLVWILRILVAAVSIIYVLLILKNKQGIPKWIAIFNPIILLLMIFSTLYWCKPLGVQIAPIAMNVTYFIFFSIVLFYSNKISH